MVLQEFDEEEKVTITFKAARSWQAPWPPSRIPTQ